MSGKLPIVVITPPGVKRRPGLRFLATSDLPVVRLEAVNRGNWNLVRVHLVGGSIQYISNDGPVLLEGGKC